MKALSLIVSFAVFMVAGYFFIVDFNISAEANHFIYISLLLILMMICVVGIILNIPFLLQQKRHINVLLSAKMDRRKSKRLQIS